MCILLNVKKHEKTFALNVDIFKLLPVPHFELTEYWANELLRLVLEGR